MSARPYPKILRTTEAADATLRTYARDAHLAPFEALILAIGLLRTKDEREAASEYNAAALDVVRADLESAREATRRADAEVERLTAEATVRAREYAAAAAKLGAETERLQRELAASTEAARMANLDRARAEAAPCACALPDDFEAKIAERAPGWKGTADELRARVITLGFSRYDALATDAAKRAAERGR